MSQKRTIDHLIQEANHILIIQADNPDADSLASSLALEQILGEMGKETTMYCGIDMPGYLKYLGGWDRVIREIPEHFDLSIIVDTSAITLLEQLHLSGYQPRVAAKPCVVLDHHLESAQDIPFATLLINDTSKVSTGEVIYNLAKHHNWPLDKTSCSFIMTSILADSMGLTTETTSSTTYRVMAELVEKGVDRPQLEEERRVLTKMHPDIFRYKAALIERTEFLENGLLAFLVIPQEEINQYSPLYNPAPLIQPDHLQTEGVIMSLVIKRYDSGRITGAIRANHSAPFAGRLAEALGGGGHKYASGFKIEKGDPSTIRATCVDLFRTLMLEHTRETI